MAVCSGADKNTSAEEAWVNPVGGLGDTLRISGVLKAVIDKDPSRRFNLIRRTAYTNLLKNHPAITSIGFPPPGARILSTAYWQLGDIGEGINRPYQILARAFGLETPIEETLYLPGEFDADPLLFQTIPWRQKNIVLAPFSTAPRKEYHPESWGQLAEKLSNDGHLVIQTGRASDQYIRHTYSVLGLTTPRQLISLVKKADLVVTVDSFAVYAAHLTGTPAVVLWGPTSHKHYGFPEQVHLQSPMICEKYDCCLGGDYAMNYDTPCVWGRENSCVNKITVDEIYDAVNRIIE
jgi:ADP-heptose:LPS heptosyltransferase